MFRKGVVLCSGFAFLFAAFSTFDLTASDSVAGPPRQRPGGTCGETDADGGVEPARALDMPASGQSEALGDSIWGFDCQSPGDDNQCLGVEFAGEYFYVTGGGGTSHPDPNKLHFFRRDGSYIGSLDQPTLSYWGWRDMAYDGSHMYSSDGPRVYEWYVTGLPDSPVLNIAGSFPGPQDPNRALAYDPATDHFWTANFASDIYEFDRLGAVIRQFPNTYSIYGMGWDTICPSGPWLWLSTQDPSTVRQFDPVTGTYTGVSFPVPGTAGGCAFSEEWNLDYGVLLYLAQDTPDHVVAYELCLQGPQTGTPRQLKLNGRTRLDRLLERVSQRRVRRHLERARYNTTRSLDWFIDDSHVDPSHGHRVFDSEKAVVNQLVLAAKHAKLTGTVAVVAECRKTAMLMARADSLLATIAVEEAEATPGADPDEIERAHEELTRACEKLGELDPEMGNHGIEWYKYDGAIDHFKKAWRHAHSAIASAKGSQALDSSLLNLEAYALCRNYPNPCRQFTTINYQIPNAGGGTQDARHTTLAVYDLRGRLVRTLVDGTQLPGHYRVDWDGRDSQGTPVPAGVYFCRLLVCPRRNGGEGPEVSSTKRLVVLR